MRYPIAIERGDTEHAYGVAVPDIPGCFSAGDSLDEAIVNAQDAILLALEDYFDEDRPIPAPSSLDDLSSSKEWKGWTWGVVDVDLNKLSTSAERINITMSSRILESIDGFARRHGETRSGFLMRAAIETMARTDQSVPSAQRKRIKRSGT
jgi:predicted RNase H-like HicB family nuclease